MNLAAIDPFLYVACAGLGCMFLTSAVILVVVMMRRARRGRSGGDSGDVA